MRTLSLAITIVFGLVYCAECGKPVDCASVLCFEQAGCTTKVNEHDCCNYCPDNVKVCPTSVEYNEPQCNPFVDNTGCKKNENCCKDGCGYVCMKSDINGKCEVVNNFDCNEDRDCMKSNEKCCDVKGCKKSCLKAVNGKRCKKSSHGASYIEVNGGDCQLCFCNDGKLDCSSTACPEK